MFFRPPSSEVNPVSIEPNLTDVCHDNPDLERAAKKLIEGFSQDELLVSRYENPTDVATFCVSELLECLVKRDYGKSCFSGLELEILADEYEKLETMCVELFQEVEKASTNNAHFARVLGSFYLRGIGTEQDNEKAFDQYCKASDLRDPVALDRQGYCHEHGIGTEVNNGKAFELYSASYNTSQKKYPLPLRHIAELYKNGKITRNKAATGSRDLVEDHIRYYRVAAEKGDDVSCYELGEFYYKTDYKRPALKYYRDAILLGHMMANYKLGHIYLTKTKDVQNPEEQKEAYEKALECYTKIVTWDQFKYTTQLSEDDKNNILSDYVDASYKFGCLCVNSPEASINDYKKAIECFKIVDSDLFRDANRLSNEDKDDALIKYMLANSRLAELCLKEDEQSTKEELKANYKMAIECCTKIVTWDQFKYTTQLSENDKNNILSDYAYANYRLGHLYVNSPEASIDDYKKAIECFKIVDSDLFRDTSQLNNEVRDIVSYLLYEFGKIYLYGPEDLRDIEKSTEYLGRSAALGHLNSLYILSHSYVRGDELQKTHASKYIDGNTTEEKNKTVISNLERLANRYRYVEPLCDLAECYCNGEIVARDIRRAVILYRRYINDLEPINIASKEQQMAYAKKQIAEIKSGLLEENKKNRVFSIKSELVGVFGDYGTFTLLEGDETQDNKPTSKAALELKRGKMECLYRVIDLINDEFLQKESRLNVRLLVDGSEVNEKDQDLEDKINEIVGESFSKEDKESIYTTLYDIIHRKFLDKSFLYLEGYSTTFSNKILVLGHKGIPRYFNSADGDIDVDKESLHAEIRETLFGVLDKEKEKLRKRIESLEEEINPIDRDKLSILPKKPKTVIYENPFAKSPSTTPSSAKSGAAAPKEDSPSTTPNPAESGSVAPEGRQL